jgi:hypothetical protein
LLNAICDCLRCVADGIADAAWNRVAHGTPSREAETSVRGCDPPNQLCGSSNSGGLAGLTAVRLASVWRTWMAKSGNMQSDMASHRL